jgi:hypothetical protein
VALRIATFAPFLVQATIIIVLALLACKAVRGERTTSARIVRIAAIGVILCDFLQLSFFVHLVLFLP